MVSEEEAKELIREWGRRHDEHLGLAGFLDILSEDSFAMKFGDNEWNGFAGFEAHQRLKEKFFDEAHVYDEEAWEFEFEDVETRVHSKMVWRCRTRAPHAPRSEQLCADLRHFWVLVRCPRRDKPVIEYHECQELKWRAGEGPSGDHSGDVHLGAK